MGPIINVASGEPYDLYIGRRNHSHDLKTSPWANPFPISSTLTRAQSLGRYYWYLQTRPDLIARLGELRDKTLACWCMPNACHGHLLSHLADGERVPHPNEYRYWLECQQCGAPAYFWSEAVSDPSAFILAGYRIEQIGVECFRKVNGNPVGVHEMIGCMVCQSIGLYMLKWSQHRQGILGTIAQERLGLRSRGSMIAG